MKYRVVPFLYLFIGRGRIIISKEYVIVNDKCNIEFKLDVYEGFSNILELDKQMEKLEIDKGKYMIIYFTKEYYAVIFSGTGANIAIGKYDSWIKLNNNLFRSPTSRLVVSKNIRNLNKNAMYNHHIYNDLCKIDSKMKIYSYGKNNLREVSKYNYAKACAVFIGATFYDTYIDAKECTNEQLSPYFNTTMIKRLVAKYSNIEAINPFKMEVRLKNGELANYQINC